MELIEKLASTPCDLGPLDQLVHQQQTALEALNISTASDDSYYSADNSEHNVCSGFDLPRSTSGHLFSTPIKARHAEKQQLNNAAAHLVSNFSLRYRLLTDNHVFGRYSRRWYCSSRAFLNTG
jgi:hypothetical protein